MNLKNDQYQAVMRQYDEKQMRARRIRDERYQEITDIIPSYAQIDTEIADLCAAQTKAAVYAASGTDGEDCPDITVLTPEELHARLEDLKAQQSALLEQAGYPADYLQIPYSCPDCHDTGYIGSEKCHCFRQAVADLLYNQSGISDILQKENFDTFDIGLYSTKPDIRLGISPRDNIQSVLAACHTFTDEFDKVQRNLLLYGDTGVGKTFLTHCIARELLDSFHTVIYLTAFQLVDILRAGTFGPQDTDSADFAGSDHIFDCDLLIIDDLGTEMNNSFVTSQLFRCINDRIVTGHSTIISTNLSLDALQHEYSERIFSRIVSNYEVLLITGDDIRVKKAISE